MSKDSGVLRSRATHHLVHGVVGVVVLGVCAADPGGFQQLLFLPLLLCLLPLPLSLPLGERLVGVPAAAGRGVAALAALAGRGVRPALALLLPAAALPVPAGGAAGGGGGRELRLA